MAVVLAFFWLASSSAWGHGLRYIAANVLKFKIWINKQQFVLDVLIFLGGKVLKSFSRSKVFNLFFFGFNVSIRIFQTSCYWFTTHFHERKNISKKSKIKFFAKIYYDAYCSGLKHVGDPENWIYQDTEDAPAHMCRFDTYLTYNWFVCLSVSNILQRFGIILIAMLIFVIYAT